VRKAMGTTSFLTIRQMSRLLRIYPDVASNSPKNLGTTWEQNTLFSTPVLHA
jgi:hypothetical protein